MNNFIKALKEAGIYDHIVKTIVDVRKKHHVKNARGGNHNHSENRNE